MTKRRVLWELFYRMFAISAFVLGGGFAIIAVAAWAFAGMSAWTRSSAGDVGFDLLAACILAVAAAGLLARKLSAIQVVLGGAIVAVAGRIVFFSC
jgi:hypothetical protein